MLCKVTCNAGDFTHILVDVLGQIGDVEVRGTLIALGFEACIEALLE